MADGRVRLTILGGYLGAGKTTWLRHRLFEAASPPHVIVNEAAPVPIDDLLLTGAAGLTVLGGACICCEGRAALIDTLRRLCDRRSAGETLTGITLETSGLADPGAIVAAIRNDPVLVHHVMVGEVIVLVDAVHGLDQLADDPLGARQVAAADRLVVTKWQGATPVRLAALLATLAALNPAAEVSGADMGVACALPSVPAARPIALPAPDAARPVLRALTLALAQPVDWPGLSLWLSALLHAHGTRLVRVKGVVRTPAGRLLIQGVRQIVQSPEVLPDGEQGGDDTLVFLGAGVGEAELAASLRHFLGA